MRRYTAAPHPFALRIESGQDSLAYRLGLTIFGRADRYLPYAIHALGEAGRSGLGRALQPFHLMEVAQLEEPGMYGWRVVHVPGQPLEARPARAPMLPGIPGEIEITLCSPLRLRHKDRLITPSAFRFSDLFGSLLRRISLLTYFHTDTPLETDFSLLSKAAENVQIHDAELRWHDWTRFSSRQDSLMEMGGLLGRFRLSGTDLEPFWPYLWLGQWTHAGKAATMGLGRYRIQAAEAPDSFGSAERGGAP